ncbi:hypothetical protein [Legionella sp.]|uniref:hypothetical protein n=1 Tax=Legionella sp. TaxID=459 RepID=UPI003CA2C8CA
MDTKNSRSKYPVHTHQLAKNALDIIYNYKPRLEAEPGLWNQFKAHINNFFEKYFGLPDILSVKTTPFGAKTQFFSHPSVTSGVSLTTEFELKCKMSTI